MAHTVPLSLLDLAFFALESAERPCNIGPLAILKVPASAKSGAAFADQLMEQMKEQPVGEPFNFVYRGPSLGRLPRLTTAKEINLNHHCHRLSLPPPGTDRQLFDLICHFHVQRLDLARPPWEFYIIDGLENNRVAIYAKVHHGIIDGVSFVQLCTRWFSRDPKSTEVRALWQGLRPPTRAARVQRSLRSTASVVAEGVIGAATGAVSLTRFITKQAMRTAGRGEGSPLPFLHTPYAFQARPSIKRSFSYCKLPIEEMKKLSKGHGFTVNDILLTVVDMALNRYQHDDGGNRNRPLIIDMPVAVGASSHGNKIAVLQFPLGSEKAKPADRVRQIHKQTRALKEQVKGESANALTFYTAAVHSVPALTEALGLRKVPMLANVMISNPFGLAEKCYLGGAEVEMSLPMSLLSPPLALNVTAATYDDSLQIAFLGMERKVPDIQRLANYTVEAFAELCAAFNHPLPASKKATTATKTAAGEAKSAAAAPATTAPAATPKAPAKKPAAKKAPVKPAAKSAVK